MLAGTPSIGGLFEGVGGWSVGLRAAGFRPLWGSEVDPLCRRVLERRFPEAELHGDVRELDPARLERPTVICGGFPCQDLSRAGLGKGIGGSRSGLWTEMARIVNALRPEAVLIENVPGLLYRGFELVVENLVEMGYGVEWDCLPAGVFGAPHFRDRAWVIAHRAPEPIVFGPAAHLFPMTPKDAADAVGGTEDETVAHEKGWARWPRAGWVDRDSSLVLPLQPLTKGSPAGPMVPTPTRQDGHNHGGPSQHDRRSLPLNAWAQVRRWPTPRASGAGKDGGELHTYRRTPSQQAGTRGLYLQAEVNEEEVAKGHDRGPLNPEWVEWLMGYPLGWTDPRVAEDGLRPHPGWAAEPVDVPRLIAPESAKAELFVPRVSALGNSLVPHVPMWIGERLRAGLLLARAA